MDIREYMQRLYTLEKNSFEQKALISQIKEQLEQAKHPKFYSQKEVTPPSNGVVSTLFSVILCTGLGAIIGAGLLLVLMFISLIAELLDVFIDSAFISFFSETEPSPKLALFIIIGAFLGFAVGVLFSIQIVKSDKEGYINGIEKNREISEKNVQIAELSKKRSYFLQNQLDQAVQLNEQTTEILSKLYSMGVVYPKYQGLVPISMLYEYLASGRCSQLQGHEGAYNLYEMEIRMNIIINKLDEIIYKLEAIKNSQYMLYQAIQESNQTAKHICNTIVESSYYLQNIEKNTEASMYFQQATAINSTYFTWYKKNM